MEESFYEKHVGKDVHSLKTFFLLKGKSFYLNVTLKFSVCL